MVPKASLPASAAARAPSTLSSSQAILLAEKYGSSSRPVRAVIAGSWPAARKASHSLAVRRSCQTMALWIGLPVARSHTSVVSRWLLMPMPATSLARQPGLRQRRAHGGDHGRPYLFRIVLDLPRPG